MVIKEPAAEKTGRKKPTRTEQAAENRDRMKMMAEVAGEFRVVKPGPEVVRRIEAVPTIFPMLDHRLRIGGWPVGRMALIHGPSSHGKTPAIIGVGRSFLERGHFFLWADLERSTPEPWMQSLLGPTWASPGFSAVPPEQYKHEQVRALHREWCEKIADARERGRLAPDTTAIAGIDSIRKLVPEKIWEELSKATKADQDEAKSKRKGRFGKSDGGMDGLNGRAGQYKAALNAVWTDELVPLLTSTRTSLVFIARETEIAGANFFETQYKVGGGTALLYESHLWLRVTSADVLDEEKKLLGERHSIEILRSKLAAREERTDYASFHTSNGVASPLGFDRARDLFELGQELDVIKGEGAYYDVLGERAHGKEKALALVRQREVEVEVECRRAMKPGT